MPTGTVPSPAGRPPEAPPRAVPFHRPDIGAAEERAVVETLRSGWLTTGPKCRQFERMFADYVGARHAVALNSCTAALHLSLVARGIGPGDEVVTSPLTFASTANVIEHVGARPVFADVEADTLNIDGSALEAAVSARTRAVIAVHFAGHPCDLDAVQRTATRHGLFVIEDAAHAIESVYRSRKIGSISPVTCFSFYATKNITTGEGGMVTTEDDELEHRVRRLSLHGISVEAWKRYRIGQYRHWDIVEPGYKYNMFDLQAALGIQQLARIGDSWERRRRWTAAYDAAFADLEEIVPLKRRPDVASAHHLYVIRLDTERLRTSRDEFMLRLQQRGVGIGIHFRPVHLHPYYRARYGYRSGVFPVAEHAGERVLSLPLFPAMTREDVQHVADQVRDLVLASRR